MANNMELLCRMWKFSAIEYMKFLKRYDIQCFGLGIAFGENIAIYAEEDKYLKLSFEDSKFNENEKQLTNLLKLLESAIEEFSKHSKQLDESYGLSEEDNTDYM